MNNGNDNLYKQEQIKRQLANENAIKDLRQRQRNFGIGDILSTGNKIRSFVGNTGKNLMNSSNPKMANFGQGLYKYSGQGLVDNFKNNAGNTITNMVDNIKGKLGFTGQGAQTNAGTGLQSLSSSPITRAITEGNQGSVLTNAIQNAGNQGSAIGGATSSAGNLAGGIGGAIGLGTSALDMANNGINFNNAKDMGVHGASLAAAATGVGVPIAAALETANGIYNMFSNGKNEEAKKVEKQAESINQSENADKQQNAMQNIAKNGQEQLQQQQPLGQDELKQKIWDAYNTQLSPGQEAGYQIAKANSPFVSDTGSDYDLRGYYKKYGGFGTDAANGHLTDEFKKPNHPTFSTESLFYNGQPYAVDWSKTPDYDSPMTTSPFSDYLSSLSDEDFNKLYNTRRRFA